MSNNARRNGERWAKVLGKSLLMLGVSSVGFLVVPDLLARQLSVAGTPIVRDTAVLAWFVICTLGASWLLVRVQSGPGVERTVAAAPPEDEA